MQFQFTLYLVILKFLRNFRSTFLIWEVGRELRNELHNEFTQRSSQQTSYKHSYMLEFRLLFVVCVLIRTFSIAARKNRKFAFGNDKPKLLLNTYLWPSTFYPWPSTFHPRLFTLDIWPSTFDKNPDSTQRRLDKQAAKHLGFESLIARVTSFIVWLLWSEHL